MMLPTKDDCVLIIMNYELGDVTFDSDVGSWNVTRAIRDCKAGKHRLYHFEVGEALANNEEIDHDPDHVAALVKNNRVFDTPPLIMCMENGLVYLIDGHHRLRAYAQIGAKVFPAYVIEEEDSLPYRIYWNGDRVSPWIKLDQKAKQDAT